VLVGGGRRCLGKQRGLGRDVLAAVGAVRILMEVFLTLTSVVMKSVPRVDMRNSIYIYKKY
jgi:hypothetical protein